VHERYFDQHQEHAATTVPAMIIALVIYIVGRFMLIEEGVGDVSSNQCDSRPVWKNGSA